VRLRELSHGSPRSRRGPLRSGRESLSFWSGVLKTPRESRLSPKWVRWQLGEPGKSLQRRLPLIHLVVDTIAFNEKTEVHGFMHTEDLHVVERFRRLETGSLQYEVTIEDPNILRVLGSCRQGLLRSGPSWNGKRNSFAKATSTTTGCLSATDIDKTSYRLELICITSIIVAILSPSSSRH
jgi:hypothetical protein